MASYITNTATHQVHASHQPKVGEALLQSAGYTHLLQIGSAADLPSLGSNPVWRKVFQFQETVGTISDYLFTKGGKTGTTDDEVADAIDTKNPTNIAYLGVQQLLAGRIPDNLEALGNALSSIGKPLDDRKMLLEDVVGWLATSGRSRQHGANSFVDGVQGQFINLLWNDLPHPPTVDLAPEHRYRSADGSYNNLTGFPLLGAAKQPYARSVKPCHAIAPDVAEPEDFFDAILRRKPGHRGFKPHPAGISSLLFGFANLIIHDLFWTNNETDPNSPMDDQKNQELKNQDPKNADHKNQDQKNQDPKNADHKNQDQKSQDPKHADHKKQDQTKKDGDSSTQKRGKSKQWQNMTSSYLSLDPLYGVDEKEQAKVRDQSDENLGKGLLYPDTFASSRLLLMPSSSCALLVLFSRNHNRIAEKVLALNEHKRWHSNVNEITSKEKRKKQDDEVFGTARLVNCNYFVQMILHDYLQSILGSVQADSDWSLDPRTQIKTLLGTTPKAMGNAVSIEFNILYWDDLNEEAFTKSLRALMAELNAGPDTDPRRWKLSKHEVHTSPDDGSETIVQGAYERDPQTGKFRDEDIARILRDSTNEVAGAFGARHTPAVLRWIDCQGMRTARDVWRACSLNEFREYLGLKAFETFKEWNSDESIANAMEDLVGHPANIPLHVGLHGEEAKAPRLGAGLCPGYTISRAILSDAVALVRGDRFYTDCATADAMTDWGLADSLPDPRDGSYGGMLQKLIINNLPNQYAYNDVALLFPFMVPEKIFETLSNISPEKAFNYCIHPDVSNPTGYRIGGAYHDHAEIIQIERMEELFGLKNTESCIHTVYESLQSAIREDDYKLFDRFLHERIKQCSVRRSPVNQDLTVDICRDVVNPMMSGWIAHVFGLVETGLHSRQLLLTALSDIYLYLTESQMTYKSRSAARVAASGLAWQLKYHIEAEASPTSVGTLIKKGAAVITVGALNMLEDTIKFLSGQPIMKNVHEDARRFYHDLRERNQGRLSADELAADCLRAAATLAYTMTHGAGHALDHLIPPADLKSASHLDLPAFQTWRDLSTLELRDSLCFDKQEIRAKYRRYGLESTRLNHWNPQRHGLIANTSPAKIKSNGIDVVDPNYSTTRDMSEYHRLLDHEGHCNKFYENIIPAIVRQVKKLNKVRKAPGRQGELSKIPILDSISGMPTMHIRYDGTPAIS